VTAALAPEPVKTKPKRVIGFRRALATDTVALYEFLRDGYFKELASVYPAPDEIASIAWVLNSIARAIVVVVECEDRIIGSFGLELSGGPPWSPASNHFRGLWMYATPEYRKGGVGFEMMRRCKEISETARLPLFMSDIWGYAPELMDRAKKIMGFKHVGGTYVWFPPVEGQ
jgi:GNAT superfamily N-acetyltransferase